MDLVNLIILYLTGFCHHTSFTFSCDVTAVVLKLSQPSLSKMEPCEKTRILESVSSPTFLTTLISYTSLCSQFIDEVSRQPNEEAKDTTDHEATDTHEESKVSVPL